MIRWKDNPLAIIEMDNLPGFQLGMQVRALWEPTLLLGWLKGFDPRHVRTGSHSFAGQEDHLVTVNTFSWSITVQELTRMVNSEIQTKLNRMKTPNYAMSYEDRVKGCIFFRWQAIILDLCALERLFDEQAFEPEASREADMGQDFNYEPTTYITNHRIVSGSHSIMPTLLTDTWT